jgi:hypothetical protein
LALIMTNPIKMTDLIAFKVFNTYHASLIANAIGGN